MSRLRAAVAVAIFVALPLSTSALEISTALGLLLAGTTGRWRTFLAAPWALPAGVLAALWAVSVPSASHLREGVGHAWPLATLLVVPALVDDPRRLTHVGLAAASIAATWAGLQRFAGMPVVGGFSHHLSLAYALLPPLGYALAVRHVLALPLVLGVIATGSEGAMVALAATVLAALTRRPTWAALAGVVVTVLALPFADADELRQRAVLWTGGLGVASGPPVGPGGYAAASAPLYDQLSPGFWFPNHAHDSTIQLLAVLGPAGVVATAGLVMAVLREIGRAHV